MFNEAAQLSPEDADVHIVLGVLYNLSREYDKAIESFQTALKLKPHDYSLWNKLGATQANSIQSADAILAYQQVMSTLITCMLGRLERRVGFNWCSFSSIYIYMYIYVLDSLSLLYFKIGTVFK